MEEWGWAPDPANVLRPDTALLLASPPSSGPAPWGPGLRKLQLGQPWLCLVCEPQQRRWLVADLTQAPKALGFLLKLQGWARKKEAKRSDQ